MARVLVRVEKTVGQEFHLPNARMRMRNPLAINPPNVDREYGNYSTCEFFEIEPEDVEPFVSAITQVNPGMAVKVYEQTQEAIRPAGELVTKKVTKEGVLPT